jgi:uncharacterized protein (TIGR02996 family)
VASLLVCVEGDWRRALEFPQLERFDDESTLFIVDPRARIVAIVDGGTPLELDHDITSLLVRLGCHSDVATWAATPRVLTPADVDALSYELRLGATGIPSAPQRVVDDAMLDELRAAVWRDPASDDARMIYADGLQDHGDPRGELIALQLERARTGGPPGDRERDLVRAYAAECVQPLARYLRSGYVLRRGFLAECVVDDRVAMSPEIVGHPAWSTVEQIATASLSLLRSPRLVSARHVAIGEHSVYELAEHPTPLPFEVLVGLPLEPRNGRRASSGIFARFFGRRHPGEWTDLDDLLAWRGMIERGALAAVRVISIRPTDENRVVDVIASDFAQHLRQLDVLTTTDEPYLATWRAAFDACTLPTLSIRFWHELPEHKWTTLDRLIALERDRHGTRIIVEVEQPLATEPARDLVRIVAQLTLPGIRAVEVRDLGDPARIAERQRELYRLLAAVFPVIAICDTPVESLAP